MSPSPDPTYPRLRSLRLAAVACTLLAAAACRSGQPASADRPGAAAAGGSEARTSAAVPPPPPDGTLRLATFNAALSGDAPDEMVDALADPESSRPRRVASVVRLVRPDILLVNEFDYRPDSPAPSDFRENFLEHPREQLPPIAYPHLLYPPVNTGVASGHDLDGDGDVVTEPGVDGYAGDAWGYGTFPGQYGMLVLSRLPIDREAVRSFRTLLWNDMPENLLPDDVYGPDARRALRLSSKTHLDIPVETGSSTLHLLVSHPTPPAFDGPANRNGRRNHDEIRFWQDYLAAPPAGSDQTSSAPSREYIVDDAGRAGGPPTDDPVAILGDLNADPRDGGPRSSEAIRALLDSPRLRDPRPSSIGARRASRRQGRVNRDHSGPAQLDTADFDDGETGNLRVDYVLPSAELEVVDSGVFWPDPRHERLAHYASASDHRLVWVDVRLETGT